MEAQYAFREDRLSPRLWSDDRVYEIEELLLRDGQNSRALCWADQNYLYGIEAAVRREARRRRRFERSAVRREREAMVLDLRSRGLTLTEISEQMSVTRERVRQMQLSGRADPATYALFVFRSLQF